MGKRRDVCSLYLVFIYILALPIWNVLSGEICSTEGQVEDGHVIYNISCSTGNGGVIGIINLAKGDIQNQTRSLYKYLLGFIGKRYVVVNVTEIPSYLECYGTIDCIKSALFCTNESDITKLCLYQKEDGIDGRVGPIRRITNVQNQRCGFLTSCDGGTDTTLCPFPQGCQVHIDPSPYMKIYTYVYHANNSSKTLIGRKFAYLDKAVVILPHRSQKAEFIIGYEVFTKTPPDLFTWNHTDCWNREGNGANPSIRERCPVSVFKTTPFMKTTLSTQSFNFSDTHIKSSPTLTTKLTAFSVTSQTTTKTIAITTFNETAIKTTPPSRGNKTPIYITQTTQSSRRTTIRIPGYVTPDKSTTETSTKSSKSTTTLIPVVIGQTAEGGLNKYDWLIIWCITGVLLLCIVLVIIFLIIRCVIIPRRKKKTDKSKSNCQDTNRSGSNRHLKKTHDGDNYMGNHHETLNEIGISNMRNDRISNHLDRDSEIRADRQELRTEEFISYNDYHAI